jgi:hypothetical protein
LSTTQNTRFIRACPGAKLGWQRQRAWMEVFSSLQITYSREPSFLTCQRRSYSSSTRSALLAKSGSRGNSHDRYCHGLTASRASHRHTVEADIASAMPSPTTSRASSGHDHRDNGTPARAANWQASALTCATCTGLNRTGRPDRARSTNPANPCAANRPRQVRTVSTLTPTSTAIAALDHRCAASSTIWARILSRCGVF